MHVRFKCTHNLVLFHSLYISQLWGLSVQSIFTRFPRAWPNSRTRKSGPVQGVMRIIGHGPLSVLDLRRHTRPRDGKRSDKNVSPVSVTMSDDHPFSFSSYRNSIAYSPSIISLSASSPPSALSPPSASSPPSALSPPPVSSPSSVSSPSFSLSSPFSAG